MTDKPIFVPLLDNGNGSVMASFMMDHAEAFAGRRVHMARASDSHANRGMNKVANAFLASECDVWINIDADIRFSRKDIDRLLSHNLPLVYGIYPKKQDDTPPCLCTFNQVPVPDENGLVEVRRCGRGFMLVRRDLLDRMKEDNGGPALRYHNHGKVEWDFFPSGCVWGEQSALGFEHDEEHYRKREWISEDWYFCEVARSLGVKTYVDTQIALGHVGPKEFRFAGHQLTRMDSDITSWREIQGWFDYEDLYRKLVDVIPAGGKFVEVGSFLGRSTAAFAEFARKAGKTINLHAVDTFQGAPANELHAAILSAHGGNLEKMFRANMAACGLNGELTVHPKPSVEAAQEFADGELDAVFIDADHREEFVTADLQAWFGKVKRGGIICGHDYDEEGVAAAVEKFFVAPVETIGRCWFVQA